MTEKCLVLILEHILHCEQKGKITCCTFGALVQSKDYVATVRSDSTHIKQVMFHFCVCGRKTVIAELIQSCLTARLMENHATMYPWT